PTPPTPNPNPNPPAAPEVTPGPESRESFSLLVGPSLLYSNDFRASVLVLSGLTWMPFSRAGLSVSVLTPVLPARLQDPEGEVELYASFYRLGAVLEATSPQARVSLRLTAAAGLGRLQLHGVATPSYLSATETHLVACPSL